jgi:azurin
MKLQPPVNRSSRFENTEQMNSGWGRFMRSTRRWLAPLSVGLSLILLVAIVIYAKNTNFQKQHGNYSPTTEAYNPGQTPQQTAPSAQNMDQQSLAQRAQTGPLQQNVDPTAASSFLEVNTEESAPGFDKNELSAKPGQIISLTFRNSSQPGLDYRDSWVLVKPNKAGEAGVAATRAGMQEDWIPHSADVLASTRLLRSGESQTIVFKAPSEPGDYPYISTFPGHSQVMKGVLHVR